MILKLKYNFALTIRLYSSRISPANKYKYAKTSSSHVYKNLYPWKTREEFVRYLIDSVVYHRDGLICINKPYGIAVDSPKEKDFIGETLATTGEGHSEYSIRDILPNMQSCLNLDELMVIKSPERYTSGIMLLASSEAVKEKVAKSLRRAKSLQVQPYTYWAVTTCIPSDLHCKQKVGIKLVEVKEFKQKVPVIEPRVSESAIKRQILKPAMVKMTCIAIDNVLNTALLEVSTSTNVWHFLRIFLAYKLSPVLGDGLYASRVKMVLGKPISVSPFNKAAYDLKPHPAGLCNQLHLQEKSHQTIPTHMHLKSLTLPMYLAGRDLTITANPPQHYVWTLRQLGLLPEEQAILKDVQQVSSV